MKSQQAMLTCVLFCGLMWLSGGVSVLYAHPVGAPIVLEGTIVTPEDVIPDGMVLIEGERITGVGVGIPIPSNAIRIQTQGLIFPGLIDLHNHITWNLFPIWKNPLLIYSNRYEWHTRDRAYQATYKDWDAKLRTLGCERNKYGELKALLGGVTSIQGSLAGNRECLSGLVRNLDFNSGWTDPSEKEKLVHVLDLQSLVNDPNRVATLKQQIANKEITSFLIHLAEGQKSDGPSKDEFATLVQLGLVGPATGIIHGTALGPKDFDTMQRLGAKLIWSPRSNLALYNQTTAVQDAVALQILVALSPDWSITGSPNMLGELKAAREYSKAQPKPIWKDDKELVFLVTVNPARIAAVDDKIGRIQKGYFADVLVINGNAQAPYTSLVDAKEEDVSLVLIGGQPYYGKPEFMTQLGQEQDSEALQVCQASKLIHLKNGQNAPNALDISFAELVSRLIKGMWTANTVFGLEQPFPCQ